MVISTRGVPHLSLAFTLLWSIQCLIQNAFSSGFDVADDLSMKPSLEILQPHKAVFTPLVSKPAWIHLPSQPFASVQIHPQLKRKPTL